MNRNANFGVIIANCIYISSCRSSTKYNIFAYNTSFESVNCVLYGYGMHDSFWMESNLDIAVSMETHKSEMIENIKHTDIFHEVVIILFNHSYQNLIIVQNKSWEYIPSVWIMGICKLDH